MRLSDEAAIRLFNKYSFGISPPCDWSTSDLEQLMGAIDEELSYRSQHLNEEFPFEEVDGSDTSE